MDLGTGRQEIKRFRSFFFAGWHAFLEKFAAGAWGKGLYEEVSDGFMTIASFTCPIERRLGNRISPQRPD